MCGLTGFFAGNTELKRPDLHAIGMKMGDVLRHRGPDAGGIWLDDDAPIVLAFRRLAIIDLSEQGAQPMVSHSGRYVIIFNGEIYNYPELKSQLDGVLFRGRSDTEVLLAGVERWGLNQTLQKINGMFAFALWDRKTRTLHFARDRMGKKPLYVGWAGKNLVFGSELKALRRHPDFKAAVNPDALELYMNHGYVPAPFSIYEKIWCLPAGHRLSVHTEPYVPGENLSELMEPYWNHLEVLEQTRSTMTTKSDEQTIEEFSEILGACVRERMISDVPLGAFLSGGIDSSTVVALMQKFSSQPVKTYTIGFHEAGFDEAAFAAKIAAHLGTDHNELYLGADEALAVIPQLPDIYDEPFADISAIPTYLVSKFARGAVTVALSGDGGDEMLGGYNRHIAGPKLWSRAKWLPSPLRKLAARGIESVSVAQWDQFFPQLPQAGNGMHKVAAILSLSNEEAIYERLTRMGGDNLAERAGAAKSLLPNPKNLSFAEKMMYWDAVSYLPNDILVKVDRASMAASLEARAPLLDRKIYEYAWTLPEKFKIRNGKGKWLLREVLKKHAPEEMFERPKQGFSMPVGDWLRGNLKDWAAALLDPARIKSTGYLDEAKVSRLWDEHQQGKGNHASQLWTVLMFEAWRSRWMA